MLSAILLLIVGFVILIKGADFLVDGASAIAKRFNISDIIIGLTIVSFGTSAPELVVNINAALAGSTEMVFGNVLGSNISNTCLILGVAGMIFPLVVQRNTVSKEIPFSIFIVLLVFFLANDALFMGASSNMVSRTDGIILLSLFFAFLFYIYRSAKNDAANDEDAGVEEMSLGKSGVLILLGLAGLVFGGDLVLENAKYIAVQFGMTERVIGLTVVAIGTSLPELATSAVAALKHKSDIAVGNVVGSNIFNILLVLSCSTIVAPAAYEVKFNYDIIFLLIVTVILTIFLFIGTRPKELIEAEEKGEIKKTNSSYVIGRYEAAVLFATVICYMGYAIISGH